MFSFWLNRQSRLSEWQGFLKSMIGGFAPALDSGDKKNSGSWDTQF
jgi:hypothetical protein